MEELLVDVVGSFAISMFFTSGRAVTTCVFDLSVSGRSRPRKTASEMDFNVAKFALYLIHIT